MPDLLLLIASGSSLATLLAVARLALRVGQYMERVSSHGKIIVDHEDRIRYLEGNHVGNRMAENRL